MKFSEITIVLGLSILSVLTSCGDNTFSLEDIHGSSFPFRHQITAIKDIPGDSILVATDDGTITFFDTKRINSKPLLRDGGGTVYDMTIRNGFLYFTIQDGGIRKVNLKNNVSESFKIPTKGTEYSPYEILLSEDGNTIYGATSNGIYRWNAHKSDDCGIPLDSLSDAKPRRFYSVVRSGNNRLVFGGDDGVYEWSASKMDLHKITDEATTAIKAGLQLSGQQIKAIEDGSDEAKPYNASFNREPKSFIGKDGYIYAISERTVECADSLGRIVATIELPERHLSRPRNKSCRALCLIKDSFLYVAPGGNQLYRIPLAPYFCSEEIISICLNDRNGIYALSANNDLYSIPLGISNASARFGKAEYIRTVMKGEAISLSGSCGDTVFVNSGGTIYSLVGKRRVVRGPVNSQNGKITCNLFVGKSLYQGKEDMVRVYDYSDSLCPYVPIKDYIPKIGELHLREGISDYYPNKLCFVDGKLVIGTLHNGVYFVDTHKCENEYVCLIDTLPPHKVLDISSVDSTAFVLTDGSLHRFVFTGDHADCVEWELSEFGGNDRQFNRILPIAEDRVYMFSDGYDFGAYEFIESGDGKWEQSGAIGASCLLSDAVCLEDIGTPIFCGSNGLTTGDSHIAVHKPSFYSFRRLDAATYWYGRVILFAALLLILSLIAVSYIKYEQWISHWRTKKMTEDISRSLDKLEGFPRDTVASCNLALRKADEIKEKFHLPELNIRLDTIIEKIVECRNEATKKVYQEQIDGLVKSVNDESGYIANLIKELVEISPGLDKLEENIVKFGKEGEKLKILAKIGQEIVEARAKAQIIETSFLQQREQIEEIFMTRAQTELWSEEVRRNAEKEKFAAIENAKNVLDAEYGRNEAIRRYNGLVNDFFREYKSDRFSGEDSSYLEKESERFGKIFKDWEGGKMDPEEKEPSYYRRSFLFFPLSEDTKTGRWLLNMDTTFQIRRSEWKNKTTTNNNGGTVYHRLHTFGKESEYSLVVLICRAGLKTLEGEK